MTLTPSSAVSFRVIGVAAPKGSMRAFTIRRKDGTTGVGMTPNNERSVKGWEAMVRSAAQAQCGGVFFDGPVRLGAVFFLPRPASLPARVRHHTKKPDLDKLVRAIKDALKGVLWQDDAQVIELLARKGYAVTQPYARIVVDHAAPVDEIAVEQDLFAPLQELRS